MEKRFRSILTFLTIILFWIYIWIFAIKPNKFSLQGIDFFSYYLGSYMVKNCKHKDIYNIKEQTDLKNTLLNLDAEGILPYKAPLTGMFFYYPFSFLNPTDAYKYFFAFQILILSVCCYGLFKIFNVNFMFLILFSVSPPVVGALLQGQQSIIITLLIIVSIILNNKHKYFLSGIFFSLILIKPNFLPILLFSLILIKNKRFIYGLISGGLIIFLTNVYFYGIHFVKDYLNFLVMTERPRFGSHKGVSHTIMIILETADSLLKTNTSHFLIPISLFLIMIVSLIIYINKEKINNGFKEKIGLSIIIGIPLCARINFYDILPLIIPVAILFNHISSGLSIWWKFILILLFIIYTLFNFSIAPVLTLLSVFIIFLTTYFYIEKVMIKKQRPVK